MFARPVTGTQSPVTSPPGVHLKHHYTEHTHTHTPVCSVIGIRLPIHFNTYFFPELLLNRVSSLLALTPILTPAQRARTAERHMTLL